MSEQPYLPESTRVVTRRGLTPLNRLTSTDLVLSASPTGGRRWSHPRVAMVRKPDSPFVAIDRGRLSGTFHPGQTACALNRDGCIEVAPLGAGSAATRYVVSAVGTQEDAPMRDEEIRLAAWLLTDSHRDRHGNWWFYQAVSKVDRILGLLPEGAYARSDRSRGISEVAGKPLRKPPQVSVDIYIRSGEFNDRLSELVPDRAALPDWVWTLSERQVDLLISEWEWTDGTVPTSRKEGVGTATVLYCSKDQLRRQLMSLMVANGWRCSETMYNSGHWRVNAYKATSAGTKRWAVLDEGITAPGYRVTTPLENLFIEQQGHVFLVGDHSLHPPKGV